MSAYAIPLDRNATVVKDKKISQERNLSTVHNTYFWRLSDEQVVAVEEQELHNEKDRTSKSRSYKIIRKLSVVQES